MTWIDAISIMFAIATIFVVMRATREIKELLSDARYERLEINRRIEKVSRRLDRIDQEDGSEEN